MISAPASRHAGTGIAARTSVGPPAGLETLNVPSTPSTRPASPARPPAGPIGRATDAVVPDLDHQVRPLAPAAHLAAGRPAVLGHVDQRLGDDEVGRPFDRLRQALTGRQVALHARRDGAAGADRLDRGDQPTVEQDGRRDAADEAAQLGQGLLGLGAGLEDQLLRGRRVRVDALARQAQVDRQHHQPLLGAVVEVALDPAQLAGLGVEHRRAALAQGLDLAAQLAGLGGADQPGDHGAVEHRDELRQGRGDRQQGDARRAPGARSIGASRPPTAGAVSSASVAPQTATTRTNSMTTSGKLTPT